MMVASVVTIIAAVIVMMMVRLRNWWRLTLFYDKDILISTFTLTTFLIKQSPFILPMKILTETYVAFLSSFFTPLILGLKLYIWGKKKRTSTDQLLL